VALLYGCTGRFGRCLQTMKTVVSGPRAVRTIEALVAAAALEFVVVCVPAGANAAVVLGINPIVALEK
jgi:hypothetical protein